MTAFMVETVLIKAVEDSQNFYQFASSIDQLSKDYIKDEVRRLQFLEELALIIKEHNWKTEY